MSYSLTPKSKILSNGLEIIVVPYFRQKAVTIHCWVFTGSAYENKIDNGITHFLEHMMFRGNKKLGDSFHLNLKFEELGGELNAATSTDVTEFWFQFHKKFLEKGIRKFCKFIKYPLFEHIEVERSIILEEIKSDYDEEGKLINVGRVSADILWKDQAMGMPIIGHEDILRKINCKDLNDWYKYFFKPGNMIFGITGAVDADKIFEWIEGEFKKLQASKRIKYPPQYITTENDKQIILIPNRDNQFSLQWSFPVEILNPNLKIQIKLINRLLDDGFSSRLQRLIREERGLVYDISAGVEFYETGSILAINAIIGVDKIFELTENLVNLIDELCQNGVTQAEWNLAKTRYEINLDYKADSPQGILADLAGVSIFPQSVTIKETLKIIQQLTLADINKTIRLCFNQNRTVLALVGPIQENFKESLNKQFQPWFL